MATASFHLQGKRVLIVGAGRSGIAAARLCERKGAHVTLTDRRTLDELDAATLELRDRVTFDLGGHTESYFENSDLIVLSPGVPWIEPLKRAQAHGIPILGEVELSSRFIDAPIVGITGSNGKSTTTTLIGEMVRASERPSFCGGNLGTPLAEIVDTEAASSNGIVVLELSSFQLETVEQFHAHIAVLLNLSEDHLDRYATYRDYTSAKARIFERQTRRDYAVVNGNSSQRECVELACRSSATLLLFVSETEGPLVRGGWLTQDAFCLRLSDDAPIETYRRETFRLPGRHNAENALAALLASRLAGVSSEVCQRTLDSFLGLPHRMEYVGEHRGVVYYNDSKATNVGSVVGSLTGFERPVVLIAGGLDKGGDYAPFVDVVQTTCRHVLLIGSAAEKIAGELSRTTVPVHRANTLSEAVTLAATLAHSGDAVVLSPACSSYDMFKNFEDRGQQFRDAVSSLHF